MHERRIGVDLDGTLIVGRPYKGPLDFPPLRPGTQSFLESLQKLGFEISIFTARSDRGAVREFLRKNGVSRYISDVTNVKQPDFVMTVDDRNIEFDGDYDKALAKIKGFKPHWEDGGDKDDQPPREYSSTQVNLNGEIAHKMKELAAKIDKADLTEKDGIEENPHVTVKFGLSDEHPGKLVELLRSQKPGTITMGKTSYFPDSGDGDVVIVEVESDSLRRLNKLIGDNMDCPGNTHPQYKPHATVAYVQPGRGKKYAGDRSLEGQTTGFHEVVFSSKNRSTESIPLEG